MLWVLDHTTHFLLIHLVTSQKFGFVNRKRKKLELF